MHTSSRKYQRDGRSPIPRDEVTSKVMSANKDSNTKPELILRKALWKSGVRGYRLHRKGVPGRPDIVFLKKRVAIFVNGCFWHRCPLCNLPLPKTNTEFWLKKFCRNVERDKEKIGLLRKRGWKTQTVWECEIIDGLDMCVKRVFQSINI